MNIPSFEVFVPVRNGWTLIEQTLERLFKQTDTDFKITLVVSASTDGTPDKILVLKAQGHPIELKRFEDSVKLAGNFNRCNFLTTGDFFALCKQTIFPRSTLLQTSKLLLRHIPQLGF